MVIEKILNNNVVVILDNNQEKIVMGKGLAYGKKVGDTFDDNKVDKIFKLDQAISDQYQEIVKSIPLEYIQVCYDIVAEAKVLIGRKLNDSIYVSLTDHIYSTISRFNEGIVISNALLYDIQRFYPNEFQAAMVALKMINERLHVDLPQDEAGYIALHFVEASFDETNMQKMYEITKVMQEITNLVKYYFNIIFEEDSVYYYRFITHLKFFAQRLLAGKTYQNADDDGLLSVIKVKYANSYGCTETIAQFVYDQYGYVLSDEEKLYLTIHIERVVYKSGAITSLDDVKA